MAIERILGTDTGKAAFEKSDRNFNSFDANKQENILGTVASGQSVLSFCDSQTKGGSFFIYADATDIPTAEWSTGFLMQTNESHANKAILVITQSNKAYINKQVNSIWSDWQKIVTDKQPDWITATLQNGWTGSLSYRKNAIGQIEIIGYVIPGTKTWGTALCAIPSGYYRSDMEYAFQSYSSDGIGMSGFMLSTIGQIKIYKPASDSASNSGVYLYAVIPI